MEEKSNSRNNDRARSGGQRDGGFKGRGASYSGRDGSRQGGYRSDRASGKDRGAKSGYGRRDGDGYRSDRGSGRGRDGKPSYGRRDDDRRDGSGGKRRFDRRDGDGRDRRDGERRGNDRRRFDRKDGDRRFDRRDGDRQGFGRREGGFDRPRGGSKPSAPKKRPPLADEIEYDAEIDEWINDGSLLEFFASCPGGMEFALGNELKECGIKRTRPLRGGVAFYGTVRDAYTACLWSRLASRVFYVVGRCSAKNEDELYEGVKAMPWSRQIPVGKTISVYGHGTNAELRNTQFTALRAKDGLCDALRAGRGRRPDVNLSRPDVLIDVNIREEKATVSIDLVGTSLHHRSYERPGSNGEGFKSAIAAAALEAAWWGRASKEGKPFVDPLCRDGYLVTEAAMVAADMAPGLARSRWGFFGWNGHDEDAWNELLDEADARMEAALEKMPPMYAIAMDERVQANVVAMLKRAGLAQYVTVLDAEDEKSVARSLKAIDGTLAGLEAAEEARIAAELEAAELEAAKAAATANEAETDEATAVQAEDADAAVSVDPDQADAEAQAESGKLPVEETRAEGGLAFSEGEQDGEAPEGGEARSAGPSVEYFGAAKARRNSVRGIAATVMPFGQDEADALGLDTYRKLVDALTALPRSWKYLVVSDDDAIERFIETRPVVRPETIRLGKVRAIVRRYVNIEPAERCEVTVFDAAANLERVIPVLEQTSEQFAARLKKNAKERRKWAEKHYVNCYRVYDADLPDYSVSIDVYHGAEESRGKTYLVIAEYQAPRDIDPIRAERRMRDILTLAPIVLGVDADKVFNRVRKREKGGGQYRSMETRSCKATVEENGCMFEVDLGGYLDTGLFLDHRITREKVGEMAVGKSFLNLFAYTGSATVHAAVCGATSTLTLDLSQTYLDWAERNMLKNGFEGREHRFLRADAMTWIHNELRTGRKYGMIFVDPPTFSNSKSMGRDTWSVQRDHIDLLTGVVRLLEPGAVAVFSCNLRTFKPDVEELERKGVIIADVSKATIPHDFERNPRIHCCYVVAAKGDEQALEAARAFMEDDES